MSDSEDSEDIEEFNNDCVVKAIVDVKKKPQTCPPDLTIDDDLITTFCFHPERNLIAVGLLSGDIALYDYKIPENSLLKQFEVHLKSCRNLDFEPNGNILFSSSSDLSIALTNIENSQLVRIYENVHEDPIHCLKVLDENLFASGDDRGIVKIWDCRVSGDKWKLSMKKNEEYISSIVSDSNQTYLVCASGDGSISTIDLRHMQYFVQTNDYSEEFTCLDLFRNESKIVAGTSVGIFYIFNWSEFGSHSDQFQTTKQSINCLVPITEDVFVAGYENGLLKAVHLFPSRDIGIVGQHDHNQSVDHLDISSNGKFVASNSYGEPIRFWNVDYFRNANFLNRISCNKSGKKNLPSSNRERTRRFFSDLVPNS